MVSREGRSTRSLSWTDRVGNILPQDLFFSHFDTKDDFITDDETTIVITHCPKGSPEWAAWILAEHRASPLPIEVLFPPTKDPLSLLEPQWPLADLNKEVAVVGTGSIGSAAALALAMYGVRKITLVDDDRLLWHNLVRHECTRTAVGKYKVDAVAEAIKLRWPASKVEPLRLNMISDAN